MEHLYLIGDVARLLDVQAYRIAYLLASHKVHEPLLRLGNRRVFTPSDVKAVATALGREWEPKREANYESYLE